MSVYVTRDIWKYSRAEHSALLVLLALGDSGHKELGTSMLKQSTVAQMTRLSVSSVRDAIRQLEDDVEIETRQAVKGRARINIYRVLLGDFALVEVDESELACRLLTPFSTPDQVAAMKAARAAGTPIHDRQNLAVVPEGDERQNLGGRPPDSASHKEEPVLGPVTKEANASFVAADAAESDAERYERRTSIQIALSVALKAELAKLTRSERGQWERSIADLLAVGATGSDVAARCVAYRSIWPAMQLTATALVRHWSLLGAHVENARPAGFDRWLETVTQLFDRDTAHEIVEDTPAIDERERARRHTLLDQRFDATAEEAA